MQRQNSILLIEDNPSDIWALKMAIEQSGLRADVHVLTDGEQALSFIEQHLPPPAPDLLILDLNLPRCSGHEVLRRWKSSAFRDIPVLVVTSSDSPNDRNSVSPFTPHYFRKPFDFDEFLKIGGVVKTVLDDLTTGAQG